MTKFITEVKHVDGKDFPVRTLYDIVIRLQFWLESNAIYWRLISDEEFSDLKWTLDNLMKQRYESGVGQTVHQAEVLHLSDEEILWSLGLLGTHSPQVLNSPKSTGYIGLFDRNALCIKGWERA